ncbi:hypothetical protein EJB05_32292, partial [Eragrostis curvula]
MSSWRSVDSHGAARRRPDDQHRENDGAGGTPTAAERAGSLDGDDAIPDLELGFGSRGPCFAFAAPHPWAHTHAPAFAPRPALISPWSVPRRPAGEAPPIHGGWPSAMQGDSGNRAAMLPGMHSNAAVPEPDRNADGRASCLPLAREAGLRAAGENRATNFVVSPLSIDAALALVAAGARGETQRELLGFLGSESLAELHRAASTELVSRLRNLPETSFACGVWVNHTSLLRPEFAATAASRYGAVAESADFVRAPEQARQRVNAFVSEATNGLIDDVLPPGSVDSSTAVVLANALYFKGTWALPFDRSRTFLAPFHLLDGAATVRAPFMTTSLFEQRVAVFPGFKALKLPYKNGGPADAAFYMLLLLPDGEAVTIGHLYDKVVSTPGFIRKHTPVGEVPVGRFMVPKFKFTFEFEASEDMKKLGVTRAFQGGDFSGMVAGGNGLFIKGVYHKATIEVDELGTVAAAATTVVMQQCARAPRLPVDFVVDRPFLFAIVEERTGAVMFIGHVVNPLAE